MNEDPKNRYEVTVNTGGSFDRFITYQDNIFHSLKMGNESMIFFKTIEGTEVAVPTRFMVTHKLIED